MTTPTNKVIVFFDRMMAVAFYALIFFLPISNAMVETFTVLALLSYLIKRCVIFTLSFRQEKPSGLKAPMVLFLKSFAPPANPLNKPVMVWLGVCLFSVLISERPSLSFDAFLGKILQNVFLFFNFVEAVRTRRRIKLFLTAFFASTLLVCLSGLNQYFFGMDFVRYHIMEHHRINSTFRAPNDFAVYLVVVLPILLSVLLMPSQGGLINNANTRYKLSIVLIGALAVVCLGLTYSRGGWLALGVALLVYVLLTRRYVKRILIGLCGFVVLFALKMIREREFIGLANIFNSFGRTTYWSEATKIILMKPVFGFGLNTYSTIGKRYSEGWGGYPHNCYLQLTAELGFVGLMSFAWIMITLYRALLADLKKLADPQLRYLVIGGLAGFTGYLVQSAFDTFFYSVQLSCLMWLVMGLLTRLIAIEET